MDQAIKKAREIIESENNGSIEAQQRKEQIFDAKVERMKPEVNSLLHTFLPEHITIGQSEVLALVICDMLWEPEKYLSHTTT